jgi:hypothetical protein
MAPAFGARAAGLALLALVLVSCGGGGATEGPSGTVTLSPSELPSRTATVPSPTRSPTRSESPTEPVTTSSSSTSSSTSSSSSSSSTPRPTSASTTSTSSPARTTTVTTTVTNTPTTATTSPTTSAESTTTPPSSAASETTSASAWLWWLLAALVVGALVAVPLVMRARRKGAWRAELAACEAEVAWFARVLVPELRAERSPERVAAAWTVGGAPRVLAVEDRLTRLEGSAPDDGGRMRTRTLRDAVRASSDRIDELVGPAVSAESVSPALDAVQADLETALGPAAQPGVSGQGTQPPP